MQWGAEQSGPPVIIGLLSDRHCDWNTFPCSKNGFYRRDERFCATVQVDLVCHGKTEVIPDKDGSDPYAVSTRRSHVSD